MRSLNARLLLAATITLAAFLGLTGFALDEAFQRSASSAVQERLQAQVYMLLSAAQFEAPEKRVLPATLPDPRLSTPSSGFYAQMIRDDGAVVWRSLSMLGLSIPATTPAHMGVTEFGEAAASDGTRLFTVSFTVRWEGKKRNEPRIYTVQVAETRQGYDNQVQAFRRSLSAWLAAAALVLLLVQAMILHWGLRPLRRVAEEVREVESGRKEAIGGSYPTELQRLVTNLNALIRNSTANLERYRRALGDLAHSFKTPLAVMRSAADGGAKVEDLRATVREQVGRLDSTVAYQLQRAAASGRSALATPIAVEPQIRKIVQSLSKVYAGRNLVFEVNVDDGARFFGDEGDLLEIVGNLSENASKWAHRKVRISANIVRRSDKSRPPLDIIIEDDGPGIPPDKLQTIFERGYRADTAVPGHGIGLAIVRDLVKEVYHGELSAGRSEALGGARVHARVTF
ncbi:MAG: ATP-binding protein [Gammaproteobacteria bacterium]